MRPVIFRTVLSSALALVPALVSAETAYRVADAIVVVKCPKTVPEGVEWFNAAAVDLTNVLSKVTGKTIPLYWEDELQTSNLKPQTPAKAVIYFGDTAAAKEAGIDTTKLRRMAFRLRNELGRTFLAANSGSAASYAMTEFLQRYADFWFLTVYGDDPVPYDPELTVPVEDATVEPGIYRRNIFDGYSYLHGSRRTPEALARQLGRVGDLWRNYQRRTRSYGIEAEYERDYRVTAHPDLRACHSMFRYLPPEKHFKDHPEWYSMKPDGHREGLPRGQLCFSHPEVRTRVVEKMLACIAEERKGNPDAPNVYDFTQEDDTGEFFCCCPECRKLVAKYNRKPGGHAEGGEAGLLLDFVNDIARRVGAVYPDVKVRTFAYALSDVAPVGIVPEKNVLMWYADLYTITDHMLPLDTAPYNAPQKERFEEWTKIAPDIEIWDYALYENAFPEISVDAFVADARYFRSKGVSRYFTQHEANFNPAFWELNHFVYAQAYFNPDVDTDRLVDIFCRSYGAQAPRMRRAIDLLRREIAAHPPATRSFWFARVLDWRNADVYERLLAEIRPAYDAERDLVRRGRLAHVLECISRDLVSVYRRMPGKAEARQRAKDAYRRFGYEDLFSSVMPEGDLKALRGKFERQLLSFDLKFNRLPPELRDVPEDEMIAMDLNFGYISVAKRVRDPKSECPLVFRWSLGEDINPPFRADIISHAFQKEYDLVIPEENRDGEYHWYRLGTGYLGRGAKFHVPTAVNGKKIHPARTPSFSMVDYYIDIDGIPEDKNPNWYDMWVSCKWSPKSAMNADDGFYVDRVVFRRVTPPKRKENVK